MFEDLSHRVRRSWFVFLALECKTKAKESKPQSKPSFRS